MILALATGPLPAAVIYVDAANTSGVEDGSVANPFNTIGEGLAIAQSGDTVQVAAGTYFEAVSVPTGVALEGAGRDVTTIDATGQADAAVRINGFGTAPRTTLRGFTVRGGSGVDLAVDPIFNVDAIGGGGILLKGDGLVEDNRIVDNVLAGTRPNFLGAGIYTVQGEPIITRNIISGNRAEQTNVGAYGAQTYAIGGGIFVGFFARPLITENTISGNTALSVPGDVFSQGIGAGIAVYAGEPLPTRIDRNLIADNRATDFSGGINVGTTLNGSSNSVITNNVLVGNIAVRSDGTTLQSYGGAGYFYYADVVFTNNTVQGNDADFGGGIMLGYIYPSLDNPTATNQVVISNNIIVRNTADGGGGIYIEESPQTIAANDVFDNLPNEYQPLAQDRTGQSGNIAVEPLWVDELLRDFHVQAGSPAIDSGSNQGAPPEDFDSVNRPIDGDLDGIAVADMGAFEFSAGADADGDGIADIVDNCPARPNTGQEDVDADGIGDACDNCPEDFNPDQADSDGDGFPDACDTCPALSNPDQADLDKDGVGDPCDNCLIGFNPTQTDVDDDTVGDACDNCVNDPNPTQVNTDQDFEGDACDADDDNDGVLDIDDCAPVDNAASMPPPMIPPTTRLIPQSGSALVTWEKVAQTHTYDLHRGDASVMTSFFYNHACLASGLLDTAYLEVASPAQGGLTYYYLPVGHNVCGSGTAGAASSDPPGPRPLPTPCAASTADADGDGVLDIRDRCPLVPDPAQVDADGDDVGSACDNCRTVFNPDQANLDGDLWGDLCDGDIDNDGIPNASDPDPFSPDGPVLPAEVGPTLRFSSAAGDQLEWDPVAGADDYALYRTSFDTAPPFAPAFQCLLSALPTPVAGVAEGPSSPDTLFGYLVTARSAAGESSPGQTSAGQIRPLAASCP